MPSLDETTRDRVGSVLGRIPSGLFVLTARHEDRRQGMLVSWVQQVCFDPPMVSVAVCKGRSIMPLISESARFGLCQLPEGERIIMRKFAGRNDPHEDPFLGFPMNKDTVTDVPILDRVLGFMECEVACHMDVDGDHDLFVGKVVGGNLWDGEPHIHLRDNGFKY